MADKNGWVVKWLVGALWGVIVLAIVTIGNNVIANDQKNTDDHEQMVQDHAAIRKEAQQSDAELRKKIDSNQEKLNKKIDKHQEKNNEKLSKLLVQQTKILTILEDDQ